MTDTKHARLSPSSSGRWMACPRSSDLTRQAPPQESSSASNEGTAAHSLLEKCILEAIEPSEFLGKEIDGIEVTDEMVSGVKLAVDYVFKKRQDIGGVIEVESYVSLVDIHPDIWGTLDISIFKSGKRLVIVDYKNGVKVVEARDNRQLLVYALGKAMAVNWDIEDIEVVIIQPNAPHNEGPIRSWVVGRDYLLNWAPILKEAARLTDRSDASLVRGEHCHYCPAKGICPKQKEAVEQALTVPVSDSTISLPRIASLTDEQIARIVEHQSQIEDFLTEVKSVALHRLENGEKIKGLKLVAGRGSRAWSNEAESEQYLSAQIGESAYTKKLISVAQAEKLLPKESLEKFWVKFEGSPTVAAASDRRKEIQTVTGTLKLNSQRSS